MFKRIVIVFAFVSMLCHQQAANAQALAVLEPVFDGVINRAVGGAILANLERRGLVTAANDAVFQSTMKWVGRAANDASYVGAAAGTVAAVAGAPVWLATAISVGALAAAGAVAWGAYQLTQTGTASAPQLTLTSTASSSPGGASSPKVVSTALVVNEAGERLMADALRFRFDRARELAGVPKDAFQFRDFRTKARTDKTESAGDIRAAQRQLGHKSR